jgi:uncharacterized damage-inducible protein DinB
MDKPNPQEYPAYFQRYISLVPDGEIIEILSQFQQETSLILSRLSEEVGSYRYEKDKWSIKEVIGHIIDTERVFTFRALGFARDKDTHLPPFDQDIYIENSNYHQRSLLEIAEEFRTVRENSIIFFKSLDDETTKNIGSTSDYNMSLRTIPYIIVGHELHHRRVIENKYIKKSLL